MMKLYHYPLSGHAHRAALFLSLTGVPHELIEIDCLPASISNRHFLHSIPSAKCQCLMMMASSLPIRWRSSSI